MASSAPTLAMAGGKPVYTARYRGLVLGLLVAAYTFNFIDRTIIATIGQAIKEDLKITDTQLGLLGGLYFALLYTLLGVPIARLAERYSRVSIISAAIVVWSAFTALCGTAQNFAMLALYRFGVGIGEAGCSPPAHSLISDYYPPKKRASALAVYAFGIPLGAMIGAAAGGWLAETFSWRAAFMIVGAPGILIAIAIKLLVKEPPRGHSEPQPRPLTPDDLTVEVAEPPRGFTLGAEFREMGAVVKILFGKGPVLHMVLGLTISSFAGYGIGQFAPPYFLRTFGLSLTAVGLIIGLVGGLSGGLGTLIGGFLTDRLARRSAAWYALTPAIGLAICAPLYLAAYTVGNWQAAAALLMLPGLFHYTALAPTFAVVQNVVDTRRRATASALMLFFVNLIALGGGPPFTGWVIDNFAQFNFTHPDALGTWKPMLAMLGGGGGGDAFVAACPGGRAAPGAGAAAAGQCHAALSLATRQGIVATIFLYLWAAAHFAIGAVGLARTLSAARALRGEAD